MCYLEVLRCLGHDKVCEMFLISCRRKETYIGLLEARLTHGSWVASCYIYPLYMYMSRKEYNYAERNS